MGQFFKGVLDAPEKNSGYEYISKDSSFFLTKLLIQTLNITLVNRQFSYEKDSYIKYKMHLINHVVMSNNLSEKGNIWINFIKRQR